jgi:hypothetical protein
MALDKKEIAVAFKISAKLKGMIDEEREKESRPLCDMLSILLAEAVHSRRTREKFRLGDYL